MEGGKNTLAVSSPAFQEAADIPSRHTCDGSNISPALRWSQTPAGTRSFAILMQDSDAPGGTFTHWILFDLPPTIDMIPENFPPISRLANGERHGTNDAGKLGYFGPCPPSGRHRYFFHVYALDTTLSLDSSAGSKAFDLAIKGRVLAEGSLMGRYQRKK